MFSSFRPYWKMLCAIPLLLSVVAAASGEGKRDAQSPTATFKARSRLVLIPAVVTDRSGKAVEGLKASDFTVLEEGHERKIAMFDEIHASSAPVALPPVAQGMYTNHGGAQQARNVVLIVLDTVNTPMMDQAYARRQIMKFLAKNVDRSALISLMMITQTGVKVIHDFTTDTNVLIAALQKLQSRHSSAQDIAVERQIEFDNVEQAALAKEESELTSFEQAPDLSIANLRQRVAIEHTLNMLRQIAQAYAGIPGRKSLIWASAGFPFGVNDFETAFSGTFNPQSVSSSDMADLYRDTWRALNDANFALYPVDVRGLVSMTYDVAARNPATVNGLNDRAMARTMEHVDRLFTFNTFAERTGGRAFINTNDLAGSFRAAASDSTAYYMLGYYLDRTSVKPGWRNLQVKINKSGTHVRARNGFFVTDDLSPEQMTARDIQMALNSPLEYTGIPAVVRWTGGVPLKGSDKVRIEFELFLPKGSFTLDADDNNHCRLETVAVARKADGSAGADVSDTLDAHLTPQNFALIAQKGLRYRKSFDIQPGEYTVRFVVRDDLSGRIGSVEAPLKVALVPAPAKDAAPKAGTPAEATQKTTNKDAPRQN